MAELLELEEDPAEREAEIQELLRQQDLVAFAEVNVVGSVETGIVNVAQANGMAGIESNTVLLGWPEDGGRLQMLLRVGRRLERLRKSLPIGRPWPPDPEQDGRPRSVHVWWGGLQRNGDLMLLLAYLLTRNREWHDARIRVLSVASNDLMRTETERQLARLISEIRIRAEVEVIVKPADESVTEVIHAESADADLDSSETWSPPRPRSRPSPPSRRPDDRATPGTGGASVPVDTTIGRKDPRSHPPISPLRGRPDVRWRSRGAPWRWPAG